MKPILFAVVAIIGPVFSVGCVIAGCGGHDAAWHNGYTYAQDNSGNASQEVIPGVFTKADWCQIARKYAIAGPVGGDFIAGCEQGLSGAGIYG
jgi:hypothetical protein